MSRISTAGLVAFVAIVLGAGGYYAGSISSSATTITHTVTGAGTTSTTTLTSTITASATSSSSTSATPILAYGGGVTQTAERLIVDTGTSQGYYSSAGLNVQWLQSSPTSTFLNYPSFIAVGTNLGIGTMSDALLAEANGTPITIVAAFSGAPASSTFFALSTNPNVKTAADIAGKTVGVVAANPSSALWQLGLYYAKRMNINYTMIAEGNATNAVNALNTGKTAVMLGGVSPLMPQGQIVEIADPNSMWPTPFAGSAIWATNSIIKSNPALVKAFVKSTLSSVTYLSQNSTYANNLYVKDFQGTPGFVLPAATTVGNINYTPSGTGGGTDLVASVTNAWQFYSLLCTGTCNAGLTVANGVSASFLAP